MKLTRAQSDATEWLRRHNGDGLFDRFGVLIAGGEQAPFMRSTWNRLRDLGVVEFYGTGRGRLRLTEKGRAMPADPGRLLPALGGGLED